MLNTIDNTTNANANANINLNYTEKEDFTKSKNGKSDNISDSTSNTTEKIQVVSSLENNIKSILMSVSDNQGNTFLNDEVLENTPKRFVKAFAELTSGYHINIKELILSAVFDSEGYDDIVLVDDIHFNSLCEHHLLPFNGEVSIAYIPNGKILGLSKFARLVEAYSKRLSLQERLTKEIATALETYLEPKGVVVMITSAHSCMSIRGVKSMGSKTKTVYTTGEFKTNNESLNKFFSLKSSLK